MGHPLRLECLQPGAAREHLLRTGRLILPAGTLELRGAHLPLGSDTIILNRLADDLSARTGIPRAPAIPFGSGGKLGRLRSQPAGNSRRCIRSISVARSGKPSVPDGRKAMSRSPNRVDRLRS